MADEDAVQRFEFIVHGQLPAKPWEPVTDYSYEARKIAEGQHPELIKLVFEPEWVWDVGCGPGHLVRMLRELDVKARGLDNNVELADDRSFFDLTSPVCENAWQDLGKRDLVICREVLEHLRIRDISTAVRNLVALSSKYIYLTTRFAKTPDHLLSVETELDVDPTHITLLTKSFLRTLFVLEGCTSRYDLEEKMDWKQFGRCLVFEVN